MSILEGVSYLWGTNKLHYKIIFSDSCIIKVTDYGSIGEDGPLTGSEGLCFLLRPQTLRLGTGQPLLHINCGKKNTVSVSGQDKGNHCLETSKLLPGYVKFCFLKFLLLQNVKLLIYQVKY